MRDAIELGKRGIPAIIILPRGFVPLAKAKAAAFGTPDLPLAVLPVMLYGRSLDEMTALARDRTEDLEAAIGRLKAEG